QYFNSTGSVTAGIKTVFTQLNTNLYDHNQSDPRHYEASMLCVVLRGADLYLGKVGSGVGLFRKDGDTQPFPTDFSYREALHTPPLGVQPEAEIRMGRYQVNSGTRLLLSDTALVDFPMQTLTGALALEDVGAVLANLRELAKRQITAMAVEFVAPNQPTRLPAKSGESTAVLTGALPTTATGEVPTGATGTSAKATGTVKRAPRGTFLSGIGARLAAIVARLVDMVIHLLDRLIPTPPEGKRSWLSSPIAAAVALLLPIIIVVLVVLFWISGTDESAFDKCIARATTSETTAQGIASSDLSGTMAAWNAVLAVSNECDQLHPGDATITAMRAEARSVLDRTQDITRTPMTPIYAFPNATLTKAVLQGEDMYVLDSGNQQVYRITLATDGMSVVPGSYTPIPAMRRSGKVINFDVSDMIDIAWADNGAGLAASNVITALDKNGILIACPPRFLQDCTAQKLQGSETWKTPSTIQYWTGRLYLLDAGANQIWRYDPSGGAFAGMPLEYFSGSNRPDITNAVDFSINAAGDLYLVTNTGQVARFRGGEQQDFAFSGFGTQSMNGPDSMFLNTNPIAQGLFFTERDQRTIFETTMA
ncbi:MAG: hypothetical protein ABI700_30525, partial [Chloroflexota bacterium]